MLALNEIVWEESAFFSIKILEEEKIIWKIK